MSEREHFKAELELRKVKALERIADALEFEAQRERAIPIDAIRDRVRGVIGLG